MPTPVSFLTKAAAFKAIWTSRIISFKVGIRYYLFLLLVVSDAANQDVSRGIGTAATEESHSVVCVSLSVSPFHISAVPSAACSWNSLPSLPPTNLSPLPTPLKTLNSPLPSPPIYSLLMCPIHLVTVWLRYTYGMWFLLPTIIIELKICIIFILFLGVAVQALIVN